MSTNIVILSGNMTKNPELKYTSSGKAVANLRIAVNTTYGKGENRKKETTFIDVRVWEKLAENVTHYLQKGSALLVEGSLREDTWEDRETGKKRSKVYVLARGVEFLGGRGDKPTEAKPETKKEALEDDFTADEVPF